MSLTGAQCYDIWSRMLAGQTVSETELHALQAALQHHDALRDELRDDVQLDHWMHAYVLTQTAMPVERDAAAHDFVAACARRVGGDHVEELWSRSLAGEQLNEVEAAALTSAMADDPQRARRCREDASVHAWLQDYAFAQASVANDGGEGRQFVEDCIARLRYERQGTQFVRRVQQRRERLQGERRRAQRRVVVMPLMGVAAAACALIAVWLATKDAWSSDPAPTLVQEPSPAVQPADSPLRRIADGDERSLAQGNHDAQSASDVGSEPERSSSDHGLAVARDGDGDTAASLVGEVVPQPLQHGEQDQAQRFLTAMQRAPAIERTVPAPGSRITIRDASAVARRLANGEIEIQAFNQVRDGTAAAGNDDVVIHANAGAPLDGRFGAPAGYQTLPAIEVAEGLHPQLTVMRARLEQGDVPYDELLDMREQLETRSAELVFNAAGAHARTALLADVLVAIAHAVEGPVSERLPYLEDAVCYQRDHFDARSWYYQWTYRADASERVLPEADPDDRRRRAALLRARRHAAHLREWLAEPQTRFDEASDAEALVLAQEILAHPQFQALLNNAQLWLELGTPPADADPHQLAGRCHTLVAATLAERQVFDVETIAALQRHARAAMRLLPEAHPQQEEALQYLRLGRSLARLANER